MNFNREKQDKFENGRLKMKNEIYKLEIYHPIYDMIEYEKVYEKIKKNFKIYKVEKFSEGETIGLIKDNNGNIMFCFQYCYLGIKPKLLTFLKTGIFFLGVSFRVLIIDIKTGKVIQVIPKNDYSAFFDFLKIKDKIIILFELEMYAINFKGDIIWQNDFSDTIVDWDIKDDILNIETDDNLKTYYSIENGKIIK